MSEKDETSDPTVHDEIKSLSEVLDRERQFIPPRIEHLPPALVTGSVGVEPAFGIGEKLVIERWVTIGAKSRWLDTETYEVDSVDGVTGAMMLWCPAKKQWAQSNWREWGARGYNARIAEQRTSISASPTKGGGTSTVTGKQRKPRRDSVTVAQEWYDYLTKRGKPVPERFLRTLRGAGVDV